METRPSTLRPPFQNKPPSVLLHAVQALKTHARRKGMDFQNALKLIEQNSPNMAEEYSFQGLDKDQLFKVELEHEGSEDCEECDQTMIVKRPSRRNLMPKVHYGNIASGNKEMKDGASRDQIAKKEKVMCFEMEAAGLMDNFPCLVIRGICDYADSHKSSIWQPYAAATSAAFARILLGFVDKQEVIDTRST